MKIPWWRDNLGKCLILFVGLPMNCWGMFTYMTDPVWGFTRFIIGVMFIIFGVYLWSLIERHERGQYEARLKEAQRLRDTL